MPPKKKANKNAGKSPFYHFLQEVQKKHNCSMHEATNIAGEMWSRMSKEAKKPYEVRAAEFKNNIQLRKYTSEGVDLEHIDHVQQQKENWRHTMSEYINNEISKAYSSDDITKKLFFIMDFNIFCYHESEDYYYPSEVGLVAFNLKDGVLPQNVYHSFIEPGDLPIGFYGAAVLESKNSHKIKPPSGIDNENNMRKVFYDILDFIHIRQKTLKQPIVVYTKEKYITMTKKILDQWCENYDDKYVFEAYNLQMMFNTLKNTISSSNLPESYAFHELSKDVYSHVSNIACEYHIELECQEFCSRSKVVRAAYTICDNCIRDLSIDVIPGQHVPDTVENLSCSRPSSQASDYSLSSSRCQSRNQWDVESTTSTIEDFSNLDERNTLKESNWTTVNKRNNTGGAKAGISTKKIATKPSVVQQMRHLSLDSDAHNPEPSSARDFYSSTSTSSACSSSERTPSVSSYLSKAQNGAGRGTLSIQNNDDFPTLGSRGRGRGLARR